MNTYTLVKYLIAILFTLCIFNASAQVSVSGAHTSSNGTYATLGAAFPAINAQDQTGKSIVVTLTASTTETASAALNAGTWTSLTIYPTITGLSISGNLNAPLIDLNGADHVFIDGRVIQTGAADLTIINSSTSATAGTSTIRFINDATNNTVKYCTIKGSNTVPNAGNGIDPKSGVVYFAGTTATSPTGNDNNTIDNNIITNASGNRPANAISSFGSITTGAENSDNIISNNHIYDFFNSNMSYTSGIFIGEHSDHWTISGNSLYETTSYSPASDYILTVLNLAACTNSSVTDNFIGGSGPQCSGVWVKTNTNGQHGNTFYGIRLNTLGTTANIQGNTIKNFNWTNSNNSSWYGMFIKGDSPVLSIGTTSPNIIGQANSTGSITVTFGATGGAVTGISVYGNNDCRNNIIGSVTIATTNPADAGNFYGIRTFNDSQNSLIFNNTIGSTTNANSIYASSQSSSNIQNVFGIYNSGVIQFNANGNTIANLTNGTTNSNTGTAGVVNGITSISGASTLANNVINNLTIANANTSSNELAAVSGIVINNNAINTLTGNVIDHLSNTSPGFAGNVTAVYFTGGNTGGNTISGNFIHDLSVTGAGSTSAALSGIWLASGNIFCCNNIISLGGNTASTIYGIYDKGVSGQTCSLYFNSVYLNGSLGSGSTNKSYCLFSNAAANTRNYRNNIFQNARSTTGGSSLHYAVSLTANNSLVMDYNDYFTNGASGGMLGSMAGTDISYLTIWQSATSQDGNSQAVDPMFTNPTGSEALNYYPSASLSGIAGTGIFGDYNQFIRSATAPKMGALESNQPAPSTTVDVYVNGSPTPIASYANLKDAFDKVNDGTHQGNLVMKLTGSEIIPTTASLNASGTGNANYSGVTIFPTLSGVQLIGNFNSALLSLNGAINVIIDGRVNAIGDTKDLVIVNYTQGSFSSTIQLINSASGNTIKYCMLKGSQATGINNCGILFFSTSSSGMGNNNNTIDHNDITCSTDAKRPTAAIYSYGTTGLENGGNIISNNNIYDFSSRDGVSCGITLHGSINWTISGNSFYQKEPLMTNVSTSCYAVAFYQVKGDNTISNNYFGGNAPYCNGTWASTYMYSSFFAEIYVAESSVRIQNNTIKNFSLTSTSNLIYYTMYLTDVISNLRNYSITGNTIGDANSPSSIMINSGGSNCNVYGIYNSSRGTFDCNNNVIGSVSTFNSNSGYATNFYGIYNILDQQGAIVIRNNTIGSTIITGSIQASSPSLSEAQVVYGIYNNGTGNAIISGNTVANLVNGTTNTAGSIAGIYYNGNTTSGTVSNNFIRDLSVSGNSGASISGINANAGTATYSNNIISLGGNTATTLYGISDLGGTNSFYFNTVYLAGAPTTGAYASYAMYGNGSNTRDYRNNIFVNARANNGATGAHYTIGLTSAPATIDYNDYLPATGNLLGNFNGSDKATLDDWKTATGQDAGSLNADPMFSGAGGSNYYGYYPTALLNGTGISGQTADYTGSPRSATTSMGALEGPSLSSWIGVVSTNWNTPGNWSTNAVPTSASDASIPAIAIHQPTVNELPATPAVCRNLSILKGSTLTLPSGKDLSVSGSWLNNGSCNFDESSKVTFNGSSAQGISGSGTNTFGNLTIDNIAGITLSSNIRANGTLDFLNGMIVTNTDTLTIGANGNITNADASKYVAGKLSQTFSTTGSKLFPIGKGGNYRPLTFNYTSLNGTSVVTAEQTEAALSGNLPANTSLLTTDRFWTISQTGGSGLQYKVTLDPTGYNTLSTVVMLKKYAGTISSYDTTTPSFTNKTPLTTLGDFTLGKICLISTGPSPKVADLVTNGQPGSIIKWYDASSGGNLLAGTTPLVNNTDYWASQTVNGCESPARVKVTALINNCFITLTTATISSITSSSAISGGNISYNCGEAVNVSGVCWSTSPNPIATGNHTVDGSPSGSYPSSITGLTQGTTYFVRAYATNSSGTAYGNEVSFTTN